MGGCHTDCIERPLRVCFGKMGHFIGSNPWWFVIIPLMLSAGLGGGFYFLDDRTSNDIEKQFTPFNGPAKTERKYIEETFPGNDSMFSSLRLSSDGNYATFIATSDSNILTVESLQYILNLDLKIRSMVVQIDSQSFKYVDICAKVVESCSSNGILDIIDYNANNIDAISLTYPWYQSGLQSIPLYLNLGSVTLKTNSSVVESAEAIQLYYYLDEGNKTKNDLWLESFINLVSNKSSAALQVSYSTSASMQLEFEESPGSVISLFSITYTIAITFSILTCWRLDNVRTKVWVAFWGVFSTGLAILSGFGLLLLIGQPLVMPALSCPFLILGIGLDDMFILISCWQRTRVVDSVNDRLADTYQEAAVSITITTLTNAVALFLGCITPFGSVRSFCIYAGVCVCFCYLYSITFLGGCMTLNGHREAGNKHWFTCAEIPQDKSSGKSKVSRMCCVGGRHDPTTGKEEPEIMSYVFERFYGPFLTKKLTKACVFVMYAGYLAVSIYGCCILKEGLDLKNLALDDSYMVDFYNDERQHFSEFSYSAMVVVKQPFPYWADDERLLSTFENLNFVDRTIAWFTFYENYAKALNLDISTQEAFYKHLPSFLELNPMFKQDINQTADGVIQASRFFAQTGNQTTMENMMIELRKTAEKYPVDLLVFHPSFIYFDQYTVIVENTVQTMLIAIVVMLVVSLLLIPNPLCSICVAFAVCSVIVGVTGFMSLWDVNLDSISMINLVMCIGFSVDFSAHISYSFVSSTKSNANEKAVESLAHLGNPIVQGALSTILGVVVLSASGSYIFRTFFKIVFLVIVIGMLHGLVFIPVFLTMVMICWKHC